MLRDLPPQDKVAIRLPPHRPVQLFGVLQVDQAGGGALSVVQHTDGDHAGRLGQEPAFLWATLA